MEFIAFIIVFAGIMISTFTTVKKAFDKENGKRSNGAGQTNQKNMQGRSYAVQPGKNNAQTFYGQYKSNPQHQNSAAVNRADALNESSKKVQNSQSNAEKMRREQYEREMRTLFSQTDMGNYVSNEGTSSSEGTCIEENPQHCAVKHEENDDIYVLNGENTSFNRQDVVKGIIMSEILGKPKCFK